MRKICRCFALVLGLVPASASQAFASPKGDAVAVVRHYYRAINAHHYRTAFKDWDHAESGVLPTGQSYAAFKTGFRATAHVWVEAGPAGELEGAAGSSFVEVPVTVHAFTTQGARQTFTGTYTLRKSNLSQTDGATAEMRRWHIFAAALRVAR
jgi:hypothetical protein